MWDVITQTLFSTRAYKNVAQNTRENNFQNKRHVEYKIMFTGSDILISQLDR